MNHQPEKNSTDYYQQGQFRAHGRVEMHLKGNIIYVDARGPFNLELINALVALEAEFLAQVASQGPFFEIVSFSESVLASLEVLEAHKQLLVMLKRAGLAHKATANVIHDKLEGAEFTAPIAAQNYAAVGWPFQIFQSMEDAENWIHSLART
ncbi:MAG: hypothetical protein V4447_05285 [Pseudomonadota bacterium]